MVFVVVFVIIQLTPLHKQGQNLYKEKTITTTITIPPLPAFVKKRAAQIRKNKPDAAVFPINEESWRKYHARDADVMRLVKGFRREVSRRKVVALAPKIAKSKLKQGKTPTYAQLRPLFIAAVMWGYGGKGYGPYRASKMLRDTNIKKVLPLSCRHILNGDMEAARRSFVVKGCGTSFYTKFFYFIGRAYGVRPMPLIMDRRVMDTLDGKTPKIANAIARYKRRERGNLSDFALRPNGYPLYVHTLNEWARQIKATPDQLEFFLFGE